MRRRCRLAVTFGIEQSDGYSPDSGVMIKRASPASSLPDEIGDFDRAFDRAFVMVALVMNRHLVDHLLRVGRELTLDDYEAIVIWGVLAHQNIAHLLPPGALASSILDNHGVFASNGIELRPLRLRDVVQITRLPRETVRRKLAKLAAQQWVERTPRGWVSSGARLEPTLREFTRESARRFLATADEMMRILRAVDSEVSEPTVSESTGPAPPADSPARLEGGYTSLRSSDEAATAPLSQRKCRARKPGKRGGVSVKLRK